jgi:hypothetical protein
VMSAAKLTTAELSRVIIANSFALRLDIAHLVGCRTAER